MSDDDDLFGSSSGDDTDDLIAASKTAAKAKPVATKKRLQKKTTPKKKAASIPDADNDSDDDGPGLFDDSDDEDEKPAKKKTLSKRERNDSDDDGPGLFDDSDDEEKKPSKKKPLSKRERMEALQKRKRHDSKSAAPASAASGDKEEKGYDSGDSYNSATYVRTKEDNDFIDADDDDQDAINELYAEQHFDDERPDGSDEEEGKKKKGKSKSGSRKRGPDSLSADEQGEIDNPIMAAVHKMKKKKRATKKLDELEEEAKGFLSKMENAADEDELAVRERRPAARKLAMLPEVLDMLARRDMMRLLLDFELLSICKRWVQPLPNGKLGNVTVRQRLIEAIGNMTGENGITASDLKRSEFGKTVMSLYMHKSETPAMKKMLKSLIEQWSRPIFNKSGNMKDLEHAQASRREAGLGVSMGARAAAPAPVAISRGRNERDLQSMIAKGATGNKEGINRVRVPFSKGFQFSVRPQGKTGNVADKRMVGKGSSVKDTRGGLSKRMLEKGRVASKNQRSANISVEGRPTK